MPVDDRLNDDTLKQLNQWADDEAGPVALHLKQKLLPIDGEGGVIFPPTYPDVGYNIDTLPDGSKVATVDSVGSQGNRLEPIFKQSATDPSPSPIAKLVPQILVELEDKTTVSILDAGHRLGDALIRSSDLHAAAREAFQEFLKSGSAGKIAKLAPTSLVFGVWDSRDTSAKLPRILQSVIRAWDVTSLQRAAQYTPPVDYSKYEVFSEEDKAKHENNPKSLVAQRGFAPVPSTGALGGVVARGDIIRNVTVNLIALRRLSAADNSLPLRRYILGLALVAATQPFDGFLRQGCLLTPDPSTPAGWEIVLRDGQRKAAPVNAEVALAYAQLAAKEFGVGDSQTVKFRKDLAKADLGEGTQAGAGKKTKKSKANEVST